MLISARARTDTAAVSPSATGPSAPQAHDARAPGSRSCRQSLAACTPLTVAWHRVNRFWSCSLSESRSFLPMFCIRGCCSWNRHPAGWKLLPEARIPSPSNEFILIVGIWCYFLGKFSAKQGEKNRQTARGVSLFAFTFSFDRTWAEHKWYNICRKEIIYSVKKIMVHLCPQSSRPPKYNCEQTRSHGAYIWIYCWRCVLIASTRTEKTADG